MSGGYAARLKKGVDYGSCGAAEIVDNERVQTVSIAKLVRMIRRSNYIVAHTGAGISTSAGIPDFRGPKGIWTKEQRNEAQELEKNWHEALPTFCHRALVELQRMDKLRFIISQNVDGLHLRSGIPAHALAELHGNVFLEICSVCDTRFYRPYDGIGFQETGRTCEHKGCGGALKDELLDWDSELPPEALDVAKFHCEQADLALCLGTSLKVKPACELPLRTLRNDRGGTIAMINLQKTQMDQYAEVRVFGYCDDVMARVMEQLAIVVPAYEKLIDFVVGNWSVVVRSDECAVIPASHLALNKTKSGREKKKKRFPGFEAYSDVDDEEVVISDEDEAPAKVEEIENGAVAQERGESELQLASHVPNLGDLDPASPKETASNSKHAPASAKKRGKQPSHNAKKSSKSPSKRGRNKSLNDRTTELNFYALDEGEFKVDEWEGNAEDEDCLIIERPRKDRSNNNSNNSNNNSNSNNSSHSKSNKRKEVLDPDEWIVIDDDLEVDEESLQGSYEMEREVETPPPSKSSQGAKEQRKKPTPRKPKSPTTQATAKQPREKKPTSAKMPPQQKKRKIAPVPEEEAMKAEFKPEANPVPIMPNFNPGFGRLDLESLHFKNHGQQFRQPLQQPLAPLPLVASTFQPYDPATSQQQQQATPKRKELPIIDIDTFHYKQRHQPSRSNDNSNNFSSAYFHDLDKYGSIDYLKSPHAKPPPSYHPLSANNHVELL